MVSITVDQAQVRQLQMVLGDLGKAVKKELAIAVNETAKRTQSGMAKDITQELAVTQKVVKQSLKQGQRAKAAEPSTKVTLEKSSRIPLRDFGARQTKRGVTYKVSRKGGRKLITSAFTVTKFGGRVFKRQTPETKRLPIIQLYGASPWGAYVINKKLGRQLIATRDELRKQVEKRIRFQALKAAGQLRGRQKAA